MSGSRGWRRRSFSTVIRFIDLFCGIGGFRVGLEKANDSATEGTQQGIRQRGRREPAVEQPQLEQKQFTCVWSCDIDRWARAIYRGHWQEEIAMDITKLAGDSVPDHDLLCAGFPCQSFSVAGRRKGFQDTRGTLFFDICRILRAKRPRYCLLENVKGLLSHDNGNTFEIILDSLDELGYAVQWQVLNSKHFGVPQNRERVFIVGCAGGEPRPEVFPVPDSPGEIYETRDGQDIAGTIETRNQSGQAQWDGSTTLIYQVGHRTKGKERVYENEIPAMTQDYGTGGQNIPLVVAAESIRRLTPVECERLQGFPDNWTAWGIDDSGRKVKISDTQRYKTLGNAVTVNVIEFLGRRLQEGLFA